MDNAHDEINSLFTLLSLAGKKPETAKEKREREENHLTGQEAYAKALAGLGKFNSLDQLNAAIAALNETIQESTGQKSSS